MTGHFGSQFMIDEWEYPPIGVYFAVTPSAGNEMVALDYRLCGPDGRTTSHLHRSGRRLRGGPDRENFRRLYANLRKRERFRPLLSQGAAKRLGLVE